MCCVTKVQGLDVLWGEGRGLDVPCGKGRGLDVLCS